MSLDYAKHTLALLERIGAQRELVWQTMRYACDRCRRWQLYELGVGVEGPEDLRSEGLWIPCPFVAGRCECGGSMSHTDWQLDERFEPRERNPARRMFRVPMSRSKIKRWASQGYGGAELLEAQEMEARRWSAER